VSRATAAPRLVHRLLVASALGAAWGGFIHAFTERRRLPGIAAQSDFAIQWFCARVLWSGGDPYLAAGPGRAFEWPAPLVYPSTTLVALGPLSVLPLHLAEVLFVALTTALFAFAVTSRSWVPLCAVLGAPYGIAVITLQWAPALAAAALMPALAWLFQAAWLCCSPHCAGAALRLASRCSPSSRTS
jgi:hypothetical protein